MDSTFTPKLNVAYMSLTNEDRMGKVERSVTLLDTDVNDDIVLDFDSDGRLIGIEFLNAVQSVRPEILAQFRRID
jgi:uncharacterized protein YuzE